MVSRWQRHNPDYDYDDHIGQVDQLRRRRKENPIQGPSRKETREEEHARHKAEMAQREKEVRENQ